MNDFRFATEPLTGGNPVGKITYAWSHLALARHQVQPSRWMFSIGWWQDERGDGRQWLIDVADRPEPSQLAPESGVVVYRLQSWTTPVDKPRDPDSRAPWPIGYDVVPVGTMGLVAMRVNADETLTIEVMPGAQDPASFAGFSSERRTYRR